MSSVSRYPDLSSRVALAGDRMTGTLEFETANAFFDYHLASQILKAVNRDQTVDISGSWGVKALYNAEFDQTLMNYVHMRTGVAACIVCDGAGFTFYVSPSAASGAPAVFSSVASFNFSGVMAAGVVPISRIRRAQVNGSNGSSVTVPSAGVSVMTLNVGQVEVGDIVLVNAFYSAVKGAAAGDGSCNIIKSSGSAAILSYASKLGIYESFRQEAAQVITKGLSGMMRVTGAGTLVLGMTASSSGSDSTVTIGNGQIIALVVRDS